MTLRSTEARDYQDTLAANAKKARTDYKGAKANTLCEECNRPAWFYVECVHMSDEVFSCMARSDLPWEHTNCGLSNISATLFDSTIIESVNLSDHDGTDSINRSSTSCSSLDPAPPVAQSSPSKQSRSTAANLRTHHKLPKPVVRRKCFGALSTRWNLM